MKICIPIILTIIAHLVLAQGTPIAITGELPQFKDNTLLILRETRGNVRIRGDTIVINNHTFTYNFYPTESSPNLLRIEQVGVRDRLDFWIYDKNVYLKSEDDQIAIAAISGTYHQKLESSFEEAYSRSDAIEEQIKVIEKHINAPSAIYNLYRIYRQIPVHILKGLLQDISDEWSTHDYVKTISNYLELEDKEIIGKGDKIHDFTAIDADDNIFQLSEQIKGKSKLTLLEFKNLYCPYSKAAIPELENIDEQHHDNLTIISFVTDTRPFLWERYLAQDTTKWLKLWDNEGEVGQTCIAYGAKGSPYYFIIDQSGKVIDAWSGYTESEIVAKIKRALN